MDGLCEAQRDSVLSSRSHSEGKRQNQREKSGSSLVLIRGVKGGGSRSEPTVYTAVLCSLGVPQEPKGFPDAVFPAIFWWETKARGGEGTHPHRPTHGVPARTGTRAISVLTKGRGKICFPQTVCLPSSHLWQTVQLEPLGWPRAMLGGRDGRVLGRESCQGGAGQLPRGRAPRSPNPRRKPNVFSRS